MELFELTRALVDIESITENEKAVGEYLFQHLSPLASTTGGKVEKMAVEADRFNLLACWGDPVVTLSTHMDTVPPFFASREDDEFIWGRGACDTKGIIAAMIFAVRQLLEAGPSRLRAAFCRGRRAQQRGRLLCGRTSARGSQVSHQRRAHREQAGAGLEGRAAFGVIATRAHGAFGVSRAGRFGDSEAARCAGGSAPAATAGRSNCSARAR